MQGLIPRAQSLLYIQFTSFSGPRPRSIGLPFVNPPSWFPSIAGGCCIPSAPVQSARQGRRTRRAEEARGYRLTQCTVRALSGPSLASHSGEGPSPFRVVLKSSPSMCCSLDRVCLVQRARDNLSHTISYALPKSHNPHPITLGPQTLSALFAHPSSPPAQGYF